MGDFLKPYIMSCHICQLFKNSKRFTWPVMQRKLYNSSQGTMTNINMDIEHMSTSGSGYNYIIVRFWKISNVIINVPMATATSLEECKTIQDNLICVFGTPLRLICDQGPVVILILFDTNNLAQLLYKSITTNHKSLLADLELKSRSNILIRHRYVRISSGGSKEGARDACPPPPGSKFFQFHAFFGKIWKNHMLAPSPESWRPLLGEILDPPLIKLRLGLGLGLGLGELNQILALLGNLRRV